MKVVHPLIRVGVIGGIEIEPLSVLVPEEGVRIIKLLIAHVI